MDSSRPRCLPGDRREPSTSLPVSIICQADHLTTSQTCSFSLWCFSTYVKTFRQHSLGKELELVSDLGKLVLHTSIECALVCPCRLEAMQTECRAALRTQRMPTTRNEEYRFTDVGPLLQIQPKAGSLHLSPPESAFAVMSSCTNNL